MDAHRAPAGQELRGEATEGARDPGGPSSELGPAPIRHPLDRETAISTLTGLDLITMLISPSLY